MVLDGRIAEFMTRGSVTTLAKARPLLQDLLIFSLLAFLALIASPLLYAQDIEEVVIQAVRSDDADTMDISNSVKAFDEEELETYQIEGFGDIANFVPGLTATPSGSQGLRFTIRGIGARDNQLGVEGRVALYVDGAFLGRSTGIVFDLVDLKQVSVIKGPVGSQGGRNAVGGAILLETHSAELEEYFRSLDLTLGNFETRKITGITNIPVGDNFAVRAAYTYSGQAGWVENLGRGVDFNGYDRVSGKLGFTWQPTDALSLRYKFDFNDADNQPLFNQLVPRSDGEIYDEDDRLVVGNLNAVGAARIGPVVQDPVTSRRLDQTTATLDIENGSTKGIGHTLNVVYDWADTHSLAFIGTYRELDTIASFSFLPNFSAENLAAQTLQGVIFPSGLNFLTGGGSFTPERTALDNGEFTIGIEEWRQFLRTTARPQLAVQSVGQSPKGGTNALDNHSQFTLEITQSGDFFNGSLEYLVGLYYFNERTGNGIDSAADDPWLDYIDLFSTGIPRTFVNASSFTDVERANVLGFSQFGNNRLDSDSYSAYSQFRYTPEWLDDRYHFTFGLRWTKDERSVYRQPYTAFTFEPRRIITNSASLAELERSQVIIDGEESWSGLDPHVKFEYDVNEDVITYLSYTKTFRPGNFNVLVRDDSPATLSFEDESIAAWELGLKGTLFQGLWQIEAAFYHYDQTDAQLTVLEPGSPLNRAVINADAYSTGFELNQSFILGPGLRLRVDYGYLETRSDEFINPFIANFNSGPLDPNNVGDLTSVFDDQAQVDLSNFPAPVLPDRNGNGIFNEQGDAFAVRTLLDNCVFNDQRIDFQTGSCKERQQNFGSPRNSWLVSLDYAMPTDWGEFKAHLGYAFTEGHSIGNGLQLDDRNLWDIRFGWNMELDAGVAKVALWSQNLFDNEYRVTANRPAFETAVFGTPRTFGVDLGFTWE